jgi:hypothetical protein
MSEPHLERRRHLRVAAPASRRWEVRLRVGPEGWRPATLASVSLGGAFIVTASPAAPGHAVELELPSPLQGGSVAVTGRIRRVASPEAAEPGIGVEFDPPTPAAVLALADYLVAATGVDAGW